MHCLIIDDNPKTLSFLTTMLEACAGIAQVHKAVQPYLIRSLLAAEDIQVIFIRVRLWDFRQVEKLEKMPVVVFLSGGKDKLTILEGTSTRYTLREPYHPLVLSILLNNIDTDRFIEAPDYFFLRYNGRFHKTMFRDIEMIERLEKNYTRFFFSYGTQYIPGTLPGWLSKLPSDRFTRVSDNLIIPTEESFKITGDEYEYKGRKMPLTFRFANVARNERDHWPDGL